MSSDRDILRHMAFSRNFGGKFKLPAPEPTPEEAQALFDKFNASFDAVFRYPVATGEQLRRLTETYGVQVDPGKQEPT